MFVCQNESMASRKLDNKKWAEIYSVLRLTSGIYTKNEANTRRFVEGVYWILRTGAPWRDLPGEFGDWNSVYKRFADWSDKEVWVKVHAAFIDDPDMEWLLLDSTIVRAHPCAAGAPQADKHAEMDDAVEEVMETEHEHADEALGRSRGGFTTKIHVTTDALGNPLRFILTGGQRHDATQAINLLRGFDFSGVIADKAYDFDELLEFIANNEATLVIPSTKKRSVQREIDDHIYKERHVVECFINKIKHFRRVFSRFEKYASRYLAFLSFAAALIWLR